MLTVFAYELKGNSKLICLVKVQKFIKEMIVRKATQPFLLIGNVTGSVTFYLVSNVIKISSLTAISETSKFSNEDVSSIVRLASGGINLI